jgi:hypothetical protein
MQSTLAVDTRQLRAHIYIYYFYIYYHALYANP